MNEYELVERQKKMLRSLAQGINEATVGTYCIASRGGNEVDMFFPEAKKNPENWDIITEADISTFLDLGFLRMIKLDNLGLPGSFTINEYKVLKAVEDNFQIPDNPSSVVKNIQIGNVSGGIVNVDSYVNNITQTIQNSDRVDEDLKQQFTLLIEQLKVALEEVPEENSEEAEAILLQSLILPPFSGQ